MSSDPLSFLRRWWWLIGISVVIAGGCTFFVSTSLFPRQYEARARVLVTPDEASGAGADLASGLSLDQFISTYSTVIQTRRVVDAVSAATPGLSSDAIARALEVAPVRDTELIDVVFRWGDPETAATVANRVATTAIAQVQESRTARLQGRLNALADQVDQLAGTVGQRNRELESLRAQATDSGPDDRLAQGQAALDTAYQAYTNAQAIFNSARLAQANAGAVLSLVEAAAPAVSPAVSRTGADVFTAAVVGLLVAVAVAWLLELVIDPLPGPGQLERVTGVRVLGVVDALEHSSSAPFAMSTPNFAAPAGEVFRRLRAALPDDEGTLLVTSAADGDGKTTVATGLAVALALADQRVILVDANLTRPGLNALVDGMPHIGLSTLLADPDLPVSSVLAQTHLARLQLVRAGWPSPNVGDLLASTAMRDLLVELRELADVVIIDGAVLDSGTLALAAAVDHVVWVLDSRHATSRGARRIARRCIEAGSAPLGLVINRAGSAA